VDKNMKTSISFDYDEARPFSDGVAAVKKNGLWGFIDEDGKKITEMVYNNVSDFLNGYASVQKGWRIKPRSYFENGKEHLLVGFQNSEADENCWWGCIDLSGNLIVDTKYWSWGPFSEGLFLFADGAYSFGYINEKHNVIIDTKYRAANQFSEGLSCVKIRKSGKARDNCFFINKKNELVFDKGFTKLSTFKNGYASVHVSEDISIDKCCGVINKEGDFIIAPQFSNIGKYYNQGLIPVKKKIYDNEGFYDEKYGFIDINSKVVIPFRYEMAKSFNNDRAAVYNSLGEFNSSCGYIDLGGELVIDFKYKSGGDFNNNIAMVTHENSYGYIDIHGIEYWQDIAY